MSEFSFFQKPIQETNIISILASFMHIKMLLYVRTMVRLLIHLHFILFFILHVAHNIKLHFKCVTKVLHQTDSIHVIGNIILVFTKLIN